MSARTKVLSALTSRRSEYALLGAFTQVPDGSRRDVIFGFQDITESVLRERLAKAVPLWADDFVQRFVRDIGRQQPTAKELAATHVELDGIKLAGCIELLVRDEEKGIIHGAAFLSDGSNGVEAPPRGTAVLVPLRRGNASLKLQGVELERVRPIVGDERTVRLALGEEDEEVEGEPAELGSADTRLTSGRPVPREIAKRLAELDPKPAWVSSVWKFWCRSRHLRTDRQEPYGPGTRTEPIPFPADLLPEQPVRRGPTLAEAEDLYPSGAVTQATVTRVLEDGSRAWLSLPDGAEATVVRQAVWSVGVLTLASVLAPELVLDVKVVGVDLHRDKPQVQVSVPDVEIPPLTEQLSALGVVSGHRLSGRVNNVNPTLGLFIEVAPKLNGLAHVSGLPARSVDGFEVGATVDVEIVNVRENPRKPGSPNIGLQILTGG